MSDSKSNQSKKLWGKAHSSKASDDVISFTASRDMVSVPPADEILIPYDLKTNMAHSKMLEKIGILTPEEHKKISDALNEIEERYLKGEFHIDSEFEDIHSQIEFEVTKQAGEAGKKIHTGRSRNDQVTTDMYLYLQEATAEFVSQAESLVKELDLLAEKYAATLCPGFTHYQKAMATTFGEILSSFSVAIARDKERLINTAKLFDYSPLGAGTGYGSLMSLDTEATAKELGFAGPFKNSIDVITNRGEFETDLASNLAILLNHISIMAQTLIVFSTKEFDFIEVSDTYTTGSSIMPQKKNPDVLEVVKSKASYVHGQLASLLSTSKGAMLGYNRDSQVTKYLIMDTIATVLPIMPILGDLMANIEVNKEKMESTCNTDFITSAGFMEILIEEKGIPMRVAKELLETSIKISLEMGEKDLISYDALSQAISEREVEVSISKEELIDWQDARTQVNRRRRRQT